MRDTHELIQRYLDHAITDRELDELNEALLNDPDARRAYIAASYQGRLVAENLADAITAPVPEVASPEPVVSPDRAHPHRFIPLALAAVVVLSAAALAIYIFAFSAHRTSNIDDRTSSPVATLIDATGTLIANDDIANPGSDYAAGEYSLESGSASLLLTSRVSVDLRGKTRLRVDGPRSIYLASGVAMFEVPQGVTGFTVHLPDRSRIIDLGTAFEVRVDDQQATFSVTEGKIQWVGPNDEAATFTVGQTVRVVAGRLAAPRYADVVRSHGPVGYWRLNETTGPKATAAVGAAATLVQGAEPGVSGATALTPANGFGGFEASNAGCVIERTGPDGWIDLPHGKSMTANAGSVSFWIARGRGGQDKLYYGSDDKRGDGGGGANELHLDLNPNGTIRLFVRAGLGRENIYLGTTRAYANDRWRHVAATWDAERTAIHIDGGALAGGETVTGPGSTARFKLSAVHRFGAPGNTDADRNYSGRVDELAIWNKALTDRQVADQYRAAIGAMQTDQPAPASETADR